MKTLFAFVLSAFLLLPAVLVACSEAQPDLPDTTGLTEDTVAITDEPVASDPEKIEYYKNLAANFNTEDFGGSAKLFRPGYDSPPVYPPQGQHPRVMVSSYNIDALRDNLRADQNASAYAYYLKYSAEDMTGEYVYEAGKYPAYALMNHIEAKAYRYLMTGDELYGYQAIYNIKNAILTIRGEDGLDAYRAYGMTMYVAACVYDWCYDLLTDLDKEQIISGVINKIGANMEVGCPPTGGGSIAHHTVECQILRSYLSFAIAVYDERPDIYEMVAGRLYDDIVPSQNYMLASGRHWEGTSYGPLRFNYLMEAQFLIQSMTNGEEELFNSEDLHAVANTFIDFMLPDGTLFYIGDDGRSATAGLYYYDALFLASAYFDDAALKGFSYQYYNNNTNFDKPDRQIKYEYTYISVVRYLILNNPDVGAEDPFADRALVNITNFPASAIFARNSWNDADAVAVYMTMPEYFSASHSHAEAGSFQIFYKGMLASDSGYYMNPSGTGHHAAYSQQTIASNSLLIYNPRLAGSAYGGYSQFVYSGGQSVRKDASRITTSASLNNALLSASMNQATILGKAADVTDGEYNFSYLAGDMAKAYDDETVDEVTRHMLSVMTDNEDVPMVFVTFDRITADDPSYKKTFLLHSLQEPEVTDDGYVIISNTKNGNSGKLVAQSLLTDMTCTVYGDGKGAEYTINGEVYLPNNYNKNHPDYRIELSPATEAKTDHLLTVMYVTDASNTAAPIQAEEIQNGEVVGAVILNRVMLFAKNPGALQSEFSFTVNGEGEHDYYVGGVAAGNWNVSVNGEVVETVTVAEGEGILTFTASAGNVTVTPA